MLFAPALVGLSLVTAVPLAAPASSTHATHHPSYATVTMMTGPVTRHAKKVDSTPAHTKKSTSRDTSRSAVTTKTTTSDSTDDTSSSTSTSSDSSDDATATSADSSTTTTTSTSTSSSDPKAIAKAMVNDDTQFACLDKLWTRESGWKTTIANSSSGAYGIPQALPGSKMASAGSDWKTNPTTQITWGLSYIKSTYGSPCGAWAHSQATGWY